MSLPPPLPETYRTLILGPGFGPRHRRLFNGTIFRVPRRILDQWKREHHQAQSKADFDFFWDQVPPEKRTQEARMTTCLKANYARIFETAFVEQQRFWNRLSIARLLP